MNVNRSATKSAVPTITRVRGVVAMVIGGTIAIGMAIALLSETRGLLNPGVQIDGSTFIGTAEQGQIAVALIALLALVGALFFAGGWQLFTKGRLGKALGVVLGIVVAAIVWGAHRGKFLFG